MTHPIKSPRKLIEVALPLDAINVAAAREKSIRHGHPSTLHLWWARRPLAAARAVIFAQLVNDPSWKWELENPGQIPPGNLKASWAASRKRLFKIIEDLVLWENTTNEEVLERARAEIRRSWREVCELNKAHPQAAELFNPEKLPALHDPFAGGGSIPLEAQRLGLEAYASDLNPVAVLINKAMIEIPPKFAGRKPVSMVSREDAKNAKEENSRESYLRGFAASREVWPGATGLAQDVRYYGAWMRAEAQQRIGHLYPPVEITAEMAAGSAGILPARPDLKPLVGQKLTVIAWLWARTVKSPNPAFSHVDVPLASTFILSSKAGKGAYVEPVISPLPTSPLWGEEQTPSPSGEGSGWGHYRFTVKVGTPPPEAKNGTKLARGANFRCLMSGTPISGDYIKAEGKAGRMGARLMAIVAEGERGRVYLSPVPEHEAIVRKVEPTWKPEMSLPDDPRNFWTVQYGLTNYGDLFTPRQLVALTTFSDLVAEARERVCNDYLGARASRPREVWHRTHLPHFEAGETPQHVCFRTSDSLPTAQLQQWEEELIKLSDSDRDSERRRRIEAALDQGHGECLLRRPDIAGMVADALRFFDGARYRLHDWVIMPNHVHVLFTPLHSYSLSSIVHSWKSFTAKQANALLGSAGALWKEDYFDRMIRNEEHWEATRSYVRNNPVKAGLCATPEDWPFGSAALGDHDTRAGRPRSQDEIPLDAGGTGAQAYADAVGVYLAISINKSADRGSTICGWDNTRDSIRNTFGRQAIPMVWDFAESNVLSESSGSLRNAIDQTAKTIQLMSCSSRGDVSQSDAQTQDVSNNKVVSTDPPYYDNIGYADLSDFFYVWLRRSLKPIFPDLFATLAVPKAEELVATPYRHGSREKAETFFLEGMTQAMHQLAKQAHLAFPVTIYYAFKQSETESESGTASTGWETFLDAVIRAGFTLSGTWPMRTELGNRMIGQGTNALASSIVLVCNRRPPDAPVVSRREFLRELNAVLPEALDEMTKGSGDDRSPVAPVDLSQAIIGPGMAVFSKYAAVLEADGSPMSVRTALQLINRFLAEDDFDADTQFCLHWFEQNGWKEGRFGEADVLARAKGTSVDGVRDAGVVESGGGIVRLRKWSEYPAAWDPQADTRNPVWETLHHLIHALKQEGETGAGRLLTAVKGKAEAARQLAYRLYTLCERQGWAEDARAYNEFITSWAGIESAADVISTEPTQGKLFV